MGGTLHISEREHIYLSAALDLERAGFSEAATYLRSQCQVTGPFWAEMEQRDRAKAILTGRPMANQMGWDEVFRIHRESNP